MSPLMTQKNGSRFVTIALPRELVDKIDIFIRNSNQMYFKRSHVVKVALSNFFKDTNGGGMDNEGKCKTG
jgi:metal-responsive CopG/Arc/MetJ family transcriptional regulator